MANCYFPVILVAQVVGNSTLGLCGLGHCAGVGLHGTLYGKKWSCIIQQADLILMMMGAVFLLSDHCVMA